MTILWEADPQVVDNVSAALGPGLHSVDSGAVATRSLLEDVSTALLVVGPGVAVGAALAVAEELRQDRPEVGVVLMRKRLDVSLLSQAARAGVREVVDAGDLGALVEACRRSRDLSERLGVASNATQDGRVIVVFSAKGGCGKTALSVNIAAQMASQGLRTLLVDLDLAFGDDAIALGLAPERTTLDLIPMTASVDGSGLRSVVTRHGSGLDVLCAPPHPGDADRITPALVTELLRVARSEYEVVVVDTPPSFDERVIATFDVADVSLVLTTPEIPSLKNLRLALDTLDLLGHPQDLRRIVLNRAGAKTGLTARDVAHALHGEVEAQVPDSPDVSQSINRGVPLVLQRPKHPVSVAVRRLVETLSLSGEPVLPPDLPAQRHVADGGLKPGRRRRRRGERGPASLEGVAARTATLVTAPPVVAAAQR